MQGRPLLLRRTRYRPFPQKISVTFVVYGLCFPLCLGLWYAFSIVGSKATTETSRRKGEATTATSRISSCKFMQTLADIQTCYTQEIVKRLDPLECPEIKSWTDVQRCLNGRRDFRKLQKQITTIHIIGERNSGTKFVQREIQKCFPRSTKNATQSSGNNVRTTIQIKAHRDFIRAKHFFQPLVQGDFGSSLIVAVFRDPVEWTAAMREQPYHSPEHVAGFDPSTNEAIPLPWQTFVNKPWTTARSKFDLDIIQNNEIQATWKGETCQERFALPEVVPCRMDDENNTSAEQHRNYIPPNKMRGYRPVYELRRDGSGRPYSNILELRSDKIFHFLLQIPMVLDIGGFLAVRYEDLLMRGTQFLIQDIASIVIDRTHGHLSSSKASLSCQPAGPQPHRIGKRQVLPEFRKWILENMNKEMEQLLDYPFQNSGFT